MLLIFLFLSDNYSPDFILVMPNIIILFNIFLTITDQMISYFTVMSQLLLSCQNWEMLLNKNVIYGSTTCYICKTCST
jgi:hypothetical protein